MKDEQLLNVCKAVSRHLKRPCESLDFLARRGIFRYNFIAVNFMAIYLQEGYKNGTYQCRNVSSRRNTCRSVA